MPKTETVKHGYDHSRRDNPQYGPLDARTCTTYCVCGESFSYGPADLPTWSERVNAAFKALSAHEESFWAPVSGKIVPSYDVVSLIGEGVHTGLRKGSFEKDSHDLWQAIHDSRTGAWGQAVTYAIECLAMDGYVLVKVDK